MPQICKWNRRSIRCYIKPKIILALLIVEWSKIMRVFFERFWCLSKDKLFLCLCFYVHRPKLPILKCYHLEITFTCCPSCSPFILIHVCPIGETLCICIRNANITHRILHSMLNKSEFGTKRGQHSDDHRDAYHYIVVDVVWLSLARTTTRFVENALKLESKRERGSIKIYLGFNAKSVDGRSCRIWRMECIKCVWLWKMYFK